MNAPLPSPPSEAAAGRPTRRVLLMPAYNEAVRIREVLADAIEALPDFEVVVVDDGSRDDTGQVAAEAGATVLRHPVNLGYGGALQTGYKYALRTGATLVAQMDADGQHDPRQLGELVDAVESGELDLAIGSRFLGETDYRMGPLKSAGRRLFGAVAAAFGLHVTDPTSGFQALDRAVLALYVQDFFPCDFPDVDVLLAVHRSGLRIGERRVQMSAGLRASTLHRGLAPVYYVYKMLLSIFATMRTRDRRAVPRETGS